MNSGDQFKLVGGHVALDFANTLDNRFDPPNTKELLGSYEDLLAFARVAGVLKKGQAKLLRELPGNQREAALKGARELRETVEDVFSAAARKEPVPPEALNSLNEFWRSAITHRSLMQKGAGEFKWRWMEADRDATSPLWPITAAAADLLQSGDLRFVRECGCETCRWLFLDVSKNHSRRWCDMKLCGNRIKARRFYESSQKSGAVVGS